MSSKIIKSSTIKLGSGFWWVLSGVPFLPFIDVIQRKKFKTPTTDPFHGGKDHLKRIGLMLTWPVSVPVGMYLVNRDQRRHD